MALHDGIALRVGSLHPQAELDAVEVNVCYLSDPPGNLSPPSSSSALLPYQLFSRPPSGGSRDRGASEGFSLALQQVSVRAAKHRG